MKLSRSKRQQKHSSHPKLKKRSLTILIKKMGRKVRKGQVKRRHLRKPKSKVGIKLVLKVKLLRRLLAKSHKKRRKRLLNRLMLYLMLSLLLNLRQRNRQGITKRSYSVKTSRKNGSQVERRKKFKNQQRNQSKR